MVQEVEQTHEEKMKMYMKLTKKELASMLIQANIAIRLMQPVPYYVPYVPYNPPNYWGTAPIVEYGNGALTTSMVVN